MTAPELMTALWLNDAELADLTHKAKPSAQARALQAMGIPYTKRPDGTLVVLRRNLDASTEKRQASPALRLPAPRLVLAGSRR
jgi:hypothetical protein